MDFRYICLMKHKHKEGIQVCGPKDRDCIESNSRKTFKCSSTCKGIYASVHWVGKSVDEDLTAEKFVDTEDSTPSKLERRLAALEKKLKVMENDRDGKGEEVDVEKYNMLIAEYKRFKKQNVQHIRFQPDTSLSVAFGKS